MICLIHTMQLSVTKSGLLNRVAFSQTPIRPGFSQTSGATGDSIEGHLGPLSDSRTDLQLREMQCCQLTRDQQPQSFASKVQFSIHWKCIRTRLLAGHPLQHAPLYPVSAIDYRPPHTITAAWRMHLHQYHSVFPRGSNRVCRQIHDEPADQCNIRIDSRLNIDHDVPKHIDFSRNHPRPKRLLD